MDNPNVVYMHFVTNSSAPSIDDKIYDDVYPHCYHLIDNIDNIDKNSLIVNEWKSISIIKDGMYNENKFIASVIFLQSTDIMTFIDKVNAETLRKALVLISKFNLNYPY